MKILLINPPYDSDCCSYDTGPYAHSPVPSFGLGYIAAFLISKGYASVEWVECPLQHLKISDIAKKTRKNRYDLIGITCTTYTYPNALELAKQIKIANKNSFVVIGGVHVSFDYDDAIRNEYVDAVAIGEGEYTTYELALALEKKMDLRDVKGIVYKEKNKIQRNPPRERIDDLGQKLPFPARQLLPKKTLGQSGASILTARGCPFDCIFCSSSKFWNRQVKFRSPENVVSELKEVIRYCDPGRFDFVDDTFTLNKPRVLRICELIRKENIKISWSCNSRVDTMDNDIALALKQAGCNEVLFGIESVTQKILDKSCKGIKLAQIYNAISVCKKNGLSVVLSFVLGLPGENAESIKALIEFIKKTDADEILVNPLIPLIGTDVYNSPEKYGMTIKKDLWKNYVEFVVETKQLSVSDLKKYYMDIIETILMKSKT